MNSSLRKKIILSTLLACVAPAAYASTITVNYSGTDILGTGGYTTAISTGAGQTVSDDTGGGGVTVSDGGGGKTVLGLEAPAGAVDNLGQPLGPWSYSITANSLSHSAAGASLMFGFNPNTPGASFYFVFLTPTAGGDLNLLYQGTGGFNTVAAVDGIGGAVNASTSHVYELEYTNGADGIYDGILGQGAVGNDDIVTLSIDGILQGQVLARADSPGLSNQVFFGGDSSGGEGDITVTEASATFTTAVPEPSSTALLGLGSLGLLLRRRR